MFQYQISQVTLQQIQIFLTVAHVGTITQAAQELNMTQPGITKSLSKLEQLLEFPLFERSRKGVTLTPMGNILYEQWKVHYQGIETGFMDATLANTKMLSKLTLGVPFTVNIGDTLEEYTKIWKQQYPNQQLSILEENPTLLYEHLAQGVVDMIFFPDTQKFLLDPDKFCWTYFAYANMQVILCETHPLAKRTSVCMEDLLTYPHIVYGPTPINAFLYHLNERFQPYQKKPVIGGYFRSNYELQNLLSHTENVYLSEVFFALSLRKGYVKIPVTDQWGGIFCIWNKHDKRKPMTQFLSLIEETKESSGAVIPQ